MPLESVQNQEPGLVPTDQIATPALTATAIGASLSGSSAERQMQLNPEWLIAKAIEQRLPVRSLEQLLVMRERLKAELAREAYFSALSGFQAECPVIPKSKAVYNKDGKTVRYRYAPLGEIIRTVAPLLTCHGLSYRFDAAFEADPPAQVVTCTVHHLLGHSEASTFRSPIEQEACMNEIQKSGSSLSYGKRYALCNALGIVADDDDDGNSGGGVRTSAEGIAEDRVLGVLKGYIDKKVNVRQLENWGKRYSDLAGLLSDEGKVELRKHYAARKETLKPIKYRPLVGEDQLVAIEQVLVSAGGTPFEEVMRLAKLAKREEDRELVQDLARELTKEQRGEIERVLAKNGAA
jgi:hypothetical protein